MQIEIIETRDAAEDLGCPAIKLVIFIGKRYRNFTVTHPGHPQASATEYRQVGRRMLNCRIPNDELRRAVVAAAAV